MDELKLIVEAISGLGVVGKEAFIYYLLTAKVLPSGIILTLIILFFVMAKWFLRNVFKRQGFSNRICIAAFDRGFDETFGSDQERLIKLVQEMRAADKDIFKR